jgi:hypothetical protein
MSRGVVIFGVNNARIDYVQLAIMCASFIRKNMPGTNVCLISDKGSVDPRHDVYTLFDSVVLIEEQEQKFVNNRRYRDTQYYGFEAQFKNESRSTVYDLSPYDETLLIDCDFLVCNDVLSHVWGSEEEFQINKYATDLFHNKLQGAEDRLNPYGIPMYWATVIYFRKGEKAKRLFDLVEHVKDNWDFYQLTYDFPGALFRNDYAFSIAIHILNGLFEESNYVVSLPDPTILSALDTDQFFGISSPAKLHFFHQDRQETWKYQGVTTNGLNVHCMNKLSLLNNMNEIMEALK